jgi:hypothetical protein
MPRRPKPSARWLLALTWPVGITLTSWDYLWRTTVMHRREVPEQASDRHLPPAYPAGVEQDEVQSAADGVGPLFHRTYSTRVREAQLDADELMAQLKANINTAAPTKFARFQRVLGDGEGLHVGDEFVVRMPGPWDGPVRVVAADDRSFRLATLDGHLEAGQIEFRVRPDADQLVFEIESWARSGDRFSNLLYHHVRMAKEIQTHMWTSFLEGVIAMSQGKMTGGVDIDTRRIDDPFPAST